METTLKYDKYVRIPRYVFTIHMYWYGNMLYLPVTNFYGYNLSRDILNFVKIQIQNHIQILCK